jgi:hypothetical protein
MEGKRGYRAARAVHSPVLFVPSGAISKEVFLTQRRSWCASAALQGLGSRALGGSHGPSFMSFMVSTVHRPPAAQYFPLPRAAIAGKPLLR